MRRVVLDPEIRQLLKEWRVFRKIALDATEPVEARELALDNCEQLAEGMGYLLHKDAHDDDGKRYIILKAMRQVIGSKPLSFMLRGRQHFTRNCRTGIWCGMVYCKKCQEQNMNIPVHETTCHRCNIRLIIQNLVP